MRRRYLATLLFILVFSRIPFTWYITLAVTTFSGQDYIEMPPFYHEQWAPHYPEFARFDYDGASYQIRLRQYRGKLFFTVGLKQLRNHLNIYELVTINFMACEHKWIFNLHFTPLLEQQACGRPLPVFRMHVGTIELTQALLGDPKPLVIYINYFHVISNFLHKNLTQFYFIFRDFHLLQQYTFLLAVSIWPF